jgi:hypothetical protein
VGVAVFVDAGCDKGVASDGESAGMVTVTVKLPAASVVTAFRFCGSE